MKMTVRAKMVLTSITEHSGWSGKTLKFIDAIPDTIPENQRLQIAAQSATAEFTVDNPEALKRFKLGEAYYVDFSPVPDAKAEG